jgi:hypothetical protein
MAGGRPPRRIGLRAAARWPVDEDLLPNIDGDFDGLNMAISPEIKDLKIEWPA